MHFEKVADPNPRFPLFGWRKIVVPWHIRPGMGRLANPLPFLQIPIPGCIFKKLRTPNPRFGLVWTPGMQCPWNIEVGLGAPGKCQDLGGTWYTRVCSKDPSSIPFRVRRLTVCCEPLLLPAAASCCSHVPPRCWHLAKQVLPHFGGCIPGRLRRAPRAADAFTRSACAAESEKIAGFANGGAASAEQ